MGKLKLYYDTDDYIKICPDCTWVGGEHDWECQYNESTIKSIRWGDEGTTNNEDSDR